MLGTAKQKASFRRWQRMNECTAVLSVNWKNPSSHKGCQEEIKEEQWAKTVFCKAHLKCIQSFITFSSTCLGSIPAHINPLCYSWQPISLLLLPSFMISLLAYSLYLFPFTCCGLVSLNPFYIKTFWTFDATIKFSAKSFSADTNYLLLLADTNNITENDFLYFQKKFITCSLCTPENDRLRCSEQRWIILIFHSSNKTFLCGTCCK